MEHDLLNHWNNTCNEIDNIHEEMEKLCEHRLALLKCGSWRPDCRDEIDLIDARLDELSLRLLQVEESMELMYNCQGDIS